MLSLKKVSKTIGNNRILDSVSFDFPSKGLYLLSGPNGSGKSSLLKILSGADARHEGQMFFDGQEINAKNADDYSYRYVGYLPQDYIVFDELTVLDNVLFPYHSHDETKARQVLEEVGLSSLTDEKGENLSSGEKARLSFARALFKDPAILLADEIGVNLDPENEKIVLALLEKIACKSLVLFVTHENEDTKLLHPLGSLEMDSGRLSGDRISSKMIPEEHSEKTSQDFSLFRNAWDSFRKNILFSLLVFFSSLFVSAGTAFFGSAYFFQGKVEDRDEITQRISKHYIETSPGIFLEKEKESLFPSSSLFETDYNSSSSYFMSRNFVDSEKPEVGNRISGVFYFNDEADFQNHGIVLAKNEDGTTMGNYPSAKDQILISSNAYRYVLASMAKADGVDLATMAKTFYDKTMVYQFVGVTLSLRVSGVYQASTLGYENYVEERTLFPGGGQIEQISSAFLLESGFALKESLLKERGSSISEYYIRNDPAAHYSSSLINTELINSIASWSTYGKSGTMGFAFTGKNWFAYFENESLRSMSWVFLGLGLVTSLIFPLAFSLANKRKMAMARLVGASRRSEIAGNVFVVFLLGGVASLLGFLLAYLALTLFSNAIGRGIVGGYSGFLSLNPLFVGLSFIPALAVSLFYSGFLCWRICPRDLGTLLEKWRAK